MIKYTIQLHMSGCDLPDGKAVAFASSKKDMLGLIKDTIKESQRYGYGDTWEALVWKGKVVDTTDVYPDLRVFQGTRGGLVVELV